MASRLFSCLAELSARDSFTPLWRPPFMASIVAEERGHLSGVCTEDGVPRFATLMALDGGPLRERGGGLIDIQTGAPLATRLDHPATPRSALDAIWLVEVTAGALTRVGHDGAVQRVATVPGLATSLSIHDRLAFVGVCSHDARSDAPTPTGPLAASTSPHRTGVAVIDLESGEPAAHAWFEEAVRDVTALAVLRQRSPMAIGFTTDELRHTISVGEPRWIGSCRHQAAGP
jgi:uncharacterized protein (TIGR03032 family)